MKSKTKEFKSAARAALGDSKIQSGLTGLFDGFHKARVRAASDTPGWEEMRERARAIKDHTIANLDYYLEVAETNVRRSGGNVFFAETAEAASSYVIDLAKANDVKMIIKGKSMLSEEMGLNDQLCDDGIETIETDLGEYILQLADQTPSHIVAPAIHMSRGDVSNLLQDKLGTPLSDDIEDLAAAARDQLRSKFIRADMGITGANFVVAETGTLVLVTNEGNGRMCTSMPRIHVAIMGMEKVIPSMEDLGLFLRLLIRSATGQRITSYVTTVNGPRASDEEDGPDEFHLVIVDNGRTRIMADQQMREALNCLRCGACLNACPVYRKVGGHAYGWVYSGPIGAIVSPMLTDIKTSKDLPFASSLCGACREACPVNINIPRMLLHLRKELTLGDTHPEARSVSIWDRLVMNALRLTVGSSFRMGWANRIGRLAQLPFLRANRLRWIPPPASNWLRSRTFPRVSSAPFRVRWKRYLRQRE